MFCYKLRFKFNWKKDYFLEGTLLNLNLYKPRGICWLKYGKKK